MRPKIWTNTGASTNEYWCQYKLLLEI